LTHWRKDAKTQRRNDAIPDGEVWNGGSHWQTHSGFGWEGSS
jgi:hypothetical protein